MAIKIQKNMRLLFIGDSITDCGRRQDPEGIGSGYPRLVRDYLAATYLQDAPEVINRGISGNKVTDLRDRWDSDVLQLKPDILSIKIGINDVWHGLRKDTPAGVPIEQFIEVYRLILNQLRSAVPQCQLVLCEPSVISPPAPAEGNERLQPYIRAVHDLGKEFNAAAVVEFHKPFIEAMRVRPDITWAGDGVHPSSTGHMLLARQWLKHTGLL
mgnify:CR=1 FL=1